MKFLENIVKCLSIDYYTKVLPALVASIIGVVYTYPKIDNIIYKSSIVKDIFEILEKFIEHKLLFFYLISFSILCFIILKYIYNMIRKRGQEIYFKELAIPCSIATMLFISIINDSNTLNTLAILITIYLVIDKLYDKIFSKNKK